MHWAKAIYEYAVDGQEILPKRKMIEEIDKQLSTFEQEISANKEIGLQGEVSVNSTSSTTCGTIPLLKSINWTINRFYFLGTGNLVSSVGTLRRDAKRTVCRTQRRTTSCFRGI